MADIPMQNLGISLIIAAALHARLQLAL